MTRRLSFLYRPLTFVAVGAITIAAFTVAVVAGLGSGSTAASPGPSIAAPFSSNYSITNLGVPPGVIDCCGGLTVFFGDPNTLLIGGSPNDAAGAMYAIGVTRDAQGHVTGFTGAATHSVDAANIDGGVAYGPGNVLFLSRYDDAQGWLGQTKPGSSMTNKIVDLAPLGVANPPGGLGFVPEGFPGAGQLKLGSYDDGNWYTLDISADGAGTYDITSATMEVNLGAGQGIEGFAFVPPGSPGFSEPSVLVAEWSGDVISAWELDANGDPKPSTRTVFVIADPPANDPTGAVFDPLTNDFLWSDWDGEVFVVQGFAGLATPTPIPTATPLPTVTSQPTVTPQPSSTSSPTPTMTPTPTVAKGDNNCDGNIQATDALVGLRFNVGLSVNQELGCPTMGGPAHAASGPAGVGQDVFGDMDCDDDVDSVDSLFILRWLAAFPVNLPGGCAEIGTT